MDMKPLLCTLLLSIALAVFHAAPATAQAVPSARYRFEESSSGGSGKWYLGREIAQVMGASNAGWLERNNRQVEENSSMAISKLPLKANSTVADIGAGTGYYTFKIAPKVPNGKVYAIEIQDEMIRHLNERKAELHTDNVEIVKGTSQSPNLPEHSIDLAIMVDVYHELLFPFEMIGEIGKALKPGGKILLLEYKAEDPAVAIRPLHKMTVKQVTKELAAAGFTLSYHGDFLPIQHFLLFEKKGE